MEKSCRILAVVRSGSYGDVVSPLSKDGETQIVFLRERLKSLMDLLFPFENLKWLVISFSKQQRAVKSAQILSNNLHKISIQDLYYTERVEIGKFVKMDELLEGIILKANSIDVGIVVVIAHGDMIPVLTEIAGSYSKKPPLGRVPEGCGYLVKLKTKEILRITGNGIVPSGIE